MFNFAGGNYESLKCAFLSDSAFSLRFTRSKSREIPIPSPDSCSRLSTSPQDKSLSPTASPGCRCRRCSLLPLDECDPKEVSSLFKFLRKRKVNSTFIINCQI